MARKSRKPAQAEDCAVQTTAAIPAWVYARISQDSDRADDSIENQIAICKEFVHTGSELTLGGVFTDLGFSGTDFERPGYSDMMAGILRGDVKCVVVKDLSRLGRTYIEVGELLFDTFVQHGIRFVSVNDNYDTFADDAGRKKLLILFKNLVNHMYSRDLGKKIKSAHAAKKKRGEPAGLPPYGYRHNGVEKRLDICPEEAEVVRQIFDMRQNGESIVGIARILNQQGIPTAQNRRYQLGEISHEDFSKRIAWTPGFVSRVLYNETYTGALVQGKHAWNGKRHALLPKDQWIVHENTHEAIISKEQFEAIALLLEVSAKRYEHKGERPHEENRYAGMIKCTRCGKTATRTDNRLKDPILYYYSCYSCVSELKHEQRLKRGAKLPLKKLDGIVMETLSQHMDTLVQFDELEEILKTSDPLKEKRASLAKERARLEKSIGKSEQNLSAAYTHHLGGLLNLKEYELVRLKIETEKTESEARLVHVKAEQSKYDVKNALENEWLLKYRAFRDCAAPTREMIKTLIHHITLEPISNEVHIVVNYSDSFEELKGILHESGGGGE